MIKAGCSEKTNTSDFTRKIVSDFPAQKLYVHVDKPSIGRFIKQTRRVRFSAAPTVLICNCRLKKDKYGIYIFITALYVGTVTQSNIQTNIHTVYLPW